MRETNMYKEAYLIEIESIVKKNNKLILFMDKFLKEYHAEDQLYLIYEKEKLKQALERATEILKQSRESQNELPVNTKKYFAELQKGIGDFILLLKWHNFSAIQKELQAVCNRETSIPYIKRRQCQCMLNMMNNPSPVLKAFQGLSPRRRGTG